VAAVHGRRVGSSSRNSGVGVGAQFMENLLSFGGLDSDFCLSNVLESRRGCKSTLTRR
jgi:hypothetical protein